MTQWVRSHLRIHCFFLTVSVFILFTKARACPIRLLIEEKTTIIDGCRNGKKARSLSCRDRQTGRLTERDIRRIRYCYGEVTHLALDPATAWLRNACGVFSFPLSSEKPVTLALNSFRMSAHSESY